jgi:RimJ/RimL family protein N-acetyltransferase
MSEWTATLRDGSHARLRTIRGDDREVIRRGFEALSDDSRYKRFFSPMSRLSEAQITYLTDVDHHDHEAVIAESDDGEPMGVARFVRTDPDADVAEVAVTVIDSWQGRGVATALLERLTERAQEEGVRRFTATALATNDDMIDLLRRMGPIRTQRADAGVVEMEVELPVAADDEAPLRRILSAAARGLMSVRVPLLHDREDS